MIGFAGTFLDRKISPTDSHKPLAPFICSVGYNESPLWHGVLFPNAMLTAERNWSQEGNCKKSSAQFTRERDHGRSQCAEAQCWVEVAVQNTRFAFALHFSCRRRKRPVDEAFEWGGLAAADRFFRL